MTLTEPTTATRPGRWSGACWIAAGVLLLTGVFHPDIFGSTFADAALDTTLWVPIHAAAVVAAILTLFGLTGLYGRSAEQLGRLGAVGFVLAVPGLVVTACIGYADAFLLPVLAREDPHVFGWDGPVVTSLTIRLTAGLALLWMVGFLLLGLALWRSGVVPRGAALALAVSAVAWVLFAGPFVPVLGQLSTLAFAASYLGVGAALWTGATGHIDPAGPARQRQRNRLHLPGRTPHG